MLNFVNNLFLTNLKAEKHWYANSKQFIKVLFGNIIIGLVNPCRIFADAQLRSL